MELRYIETVLQEETCKTASGICISGERRLAFRPVINNAAPAVSTNSLIPFSGDEFVRTQYQNSVCTPGFVDTGLISLFDYHFFGPCSLPVDIYRGVGLIGEPICWGPDFAQWYVESHGVESTLQELRDRSDLAKLFQIDRRLVIRDEIVLLSAPGQDIYGHWLIDFVPRLYTLAQSDKARLPIYLYSLPEWARSFVKMMGFNPAHFKRHPGHAFKAECAIIPSASKSGYRFGADSMRAAWQQLTLAAPPPSLRRAPMKKKVFFSRRGWGQGNRSSPEGIERIESAFSSRGYDIIRPEQMSVQQQIQMMAGVTHVAGEDGSALHNIIFCPPGARLGVISRPDRQNLWHMSICEVLDHKLSYLNLSEDEVSTGVDDKKLNLFIDSIEG